MTHTISMMTKPGNLIEIRDTSEYTELDPFQDYGRAFYVKLNDTMLQFTHKQPMDISYNVNYNANGRYDAKVFFFPWYDSEAIYTVGQIVAYSIAVNAQPGDPSPKGMFPTTVSLFRATDTIAAGETPQSSDLWEYLDEATSYDQCEASVLASIGSVATANLLVADGDITIVKFDEYKYQISFPGTCDMAIYRFKDWLNNGTPLINESVTETYTFNTEALATQLELFIVSIDVGETTYIGIVYEITKLVEVVNALVRVLYCIDNEDEDCRGITTKQEEKSRRDMNTIMALWHSLFWKLNHSYATSIFVGNLSENAVTLLQEIEKELERLKVTIENVDYDTF